MRRGAHVARGEFLPTTSRLSPFSTAGRMQPCRIGGHLILLVYFSALPVHFAREMATSETQQRRGKLPNDSCNQHGPSAWFTDRMHPGKWRVLGSVENLL